MISTTNNTNRIEDIILRHSARGMDLLRPYMPDDFCGRAADAILSWERGTVLLTTGFYVRGYAETDGPSGTYTVARALEGLGFHPVIVTDSYCAAFFSGRGFDTVPMKPDDGEAFCRELLDTRKPVGLVSVERCGRNLNDDYANFRGVSIRANTAPADLLFELAAGRIPTIGIGDGGNEIGMGVLKHEISTLLSLNPCRIPADHLIIATVSNWGAYGLAASLEKKTGLKLMPDAAEIASFLKWTVSMGSVDGISGDHVAKVDGFPLETELGIVRDLTKAVRN